MSGPFALPPSRDRSTVQQTTCIEFENPEHPNVWKDDKVSELNFNAALWLKHEFGSERDMVVGAFALALQAEVKGEHEEGQMPLDELVEQLRQEYVI